MCYNGEGEPFFFALLIGILREIFKYQDSRVENMRIIGRTQIEIEGLRGATGFETDPVYLNTFKEMRALWAKDEEFKRDIRRLKRLLKGVGYYD